MVHGSIDKMTKGHLPLQDYLARLSYLAVLLLASFLFLPRSSTWISQTHLISIQHSSSDRPEHPFLTPLTSDPLSTMAWTLPGTFIIMIWWSHHMSNWWTGLDQGEKRVVDERELLLWQNRLKRTTKVSPAKKIYHMDSHSLCSACQSLRCVL